MSWFILGKQSCELRLPLGFLKSVVIESLQFNQGFVNAEICAAFCPPVRIAVRATAARISDYRINVVF